MTNSGGPLDNQTCKRRNKSFQSLVFVLTQLHFGKWNSLLFCMPSLIVQFVTFSISGDDVTKIIFSRLFGTEKNSHDKNCLFSALNSWDMGFWSSNCFKLSYLVLVREVRNKGSKREVSMGLCQLQTSSSLSFTLAIWNFAHVLTTAVYIAWWGGEVCKMMTSQNSIQVVRGFSWDFFSMSCSIFLEEKRAVVCKIYSFLPRRLWQRKTELRGKFNFVTLLYKGCIFKWVYKKNLKQSARLSGEKGYNSQHPFVSSMFIYSVVVVVIFHQRFLQFRQTRDTADFVFMRRQTTDTTVGSLTSPGFNLRLSALWTNWSQRFDLFSLHFTSFIHSFIHLRRSIIKDKLRAILLFSCEDNLSDKCAVRGRRRSFGSSHNPRHAIFRKTWRARGTCAWRLSWSSSEGVKRWIPRVFFVLPPLHPLFCDSHL